MRSVVRSFCSLLLLIVPIPAFAQVSNFRHVIVIFQENRTPDNLFQGLCAPPFGGSNSCSTTPTGRQYNIQTKDWLDKYSGTGVTQPLPIPLVNDYDFKHNHLAFVLQCDKNASGRCRMDGAADVICVPTSACNNTPHPQFRYVDYNQGAVNPYLELATQYGWANYMFQTNQGPSFPAHQYIFGATSAPSAADDHAGIFSSENTGGIGIGAGCIADPGVTVQLIDPFGVEDPKNVIYPCFDHDTVPDLLKPLGITWKYYAPGPNGIWTAPNAISHICQASGGQCTGSDWLNNVDLKSADVLADIANCQLRQVTWVMPTGDNSDHPRDNTGGGPSWVASIVNAIGNSWSNSNQRCDYWGNNSNDATAIFIAWDDWGGWYDHEPPRILAFPQGGYQFGFRVPLIVVSAFTPPQFVLNNRFDFGSIVRYIEHNFGIQEGALTFADARISTDLTSFFKLNHAPRPFVTINAPKGAEYFLNDKAPQTAPDDE
jgi:phospholipase C